MHGYFLEMRAYQKLAAVSNPFAYEEYRKEKIAQALKDKAQKRINVQ